MRICLILLCSFFFLAACNDSKKNEESTTREIYQEGSSGESKAHTKSATPKEDRESTEASSKIEKVTFEDLSGIYINTEHQDDTDCYCYCLEVKESGSTKLCLKKDDIYINARFQQNGNQINVYYSGKAKETKAQNIPWDKFDTGIPIAVIEPGMPGEFDLDWKGFSIEGKTAIEYALYGKKTLEGTYKKK